MFSIRLFEDSSDFLHLTLEYNSPTASFQFSPENPDKNPRKIPYSIPDEGGISWNTSAGSFSFRWNEDSFVFEVGTFGDGEGGTMITTVPNSPATMASFRKALREWEYAVAM